MRSVAASITLYFTHVFVGDVEKRSEIAQRSPLAMAFGPLQFGQGVSYPCWPRIPQRPGHISAIEN